MTDEVEAKPWWRTVTGQPASFASGKNKVWHGYAVASLGFLLFGVLTFIEPSKSLGGAMVGSAITTAALAVKFRND